MTRFATKPIVISANNILLILIVIGLGYLYTKIWPQAPFLASDSPGYLEVAQDLEDFKIDSLHDRTFGYPLLLTLTRATHYPTRGLYYVQLILHFMAILLLVHLSNVMHFHKWTKLFFVLLSMLPLYVFPSAYVLTETLTEFLLIIGFVGLSTWLIDNNRLVPLLSGSLAIALSAIVRPTYQLLSIIIACLFFVLALLLKMKPKKVILGGIVVILMSTLIIGGNIFFNYYKFRYAGLTPLFGFNLCTRTVRVLERLPEEIAPLRETLIKYRDESLTQRGSSHYGVMYIWAAIPELQRVTGLSKPQLSDLMVSINIKLIRSAPLEYLAEVLRAMSTYWFPYTSEVVNFSSRKIQLVWTIIHFLVISSFFLSLYIASSILTVRAFLLSAVKQHNEQVTFQSFLHISSIPLQQLVVLGLACTIIFYTFMISTFVEVGNPRYRSPTDLLIIFLTLVIFEWLRTAYSQILEKRLEE